MTENGRTSAIPNSSKAQSLLERCCWKYSKTSLVYRASNFEQPLIIIIHEARLIKDWISFVCECCILRTNLRFGCHSPCTEVIRLVNLRAWMLCTNFLLSQISHPHLRTDLRSLNPISWVEVIISTIFGIILLDSKIWWDEVPIFNIINILSHRYFDGMTWKGLKNSSRSPKRPYPVVVHTCLQLILLSVDT